MTKIKICGITTLSDAVASAAAGADAVGFNFYMNSPRYVTGNEVRMISEQLPAGLKKIGVFVNSSADEVLTVAGSCDLDGIQLHGDEPPAFVSQLRKESRLFLIKAFRVGPHFDPQIVCEFDVDAVLLDAFSPAGPGGTGEQFDWKIAVKIREMVKRLYLAGGLGPDNAARAISLVRPYGIDACSRLEASKGIKDHEKIKEFAAAARNAK